MFAPCCCRSAITAAITALSTRFASLVRGYRHTLLRQTRGTAALADIAHGQVEYKELAKALAASGADTSANATKALFGARDKLSELAKDLRRSLATVHTTFADADAAASGDGEAFGDVPDATVDAALGSLIPSVDASAKDKVRCLWCGAAWMTRTVGCGVRVQGLSLEPSRGFARRDGSIERVREERECVCLCDRVAYTASIS